MSLKSDTHYSTTMRIGSSPMTYRSNLVNVLVKSSTVCPCLSVSRLKARGVLGNLEDGQVNCTKKSTDRTLTFIVVGRVRICRLWCIPIGLFTEPRFGSPDFG